MTNPGPWTATGQPETKKSRTWWIVGGVVLAVVVVFVAFLAGLGWEDANEQTTAADDPASQFRLPLSPGAATAITDRWPGPDPLADDEAEVWARNLCTARLNGAPIEDLYDQIPLSSERQVLTAIAKPQYEEFFVATTLHEACPEMVPR